VRGLIVTSDDFGADLAVNEAVEMAHSQGVLTAASLMVAAPAAADAVARAHRLPTLRVGLHLTLTEAQSALPPDRLDRLVGPDGRFSENMAAAGAVMFFSPRARRQLADEITAQFEAFQATGLTLDHVNAHKHFHLHPTIAGLMIRIGARFGLRAVRVPNEPAAILRRVEPSPTRTSDRLFAAMAAWTRRRFAAAGIATPDQVFGLRWSGAMTPPRLEGLIAALPPGLSEIYLHPATADLFPGAASGYRYRDELAALVDPGVKAAATRSDLRRGGFGDFL
jgi:hopanoid biosynthesis associated protein HpnK